MAEIRVLDKHTAELIAAGEVVERPASVAKELLENAIDAGATQITLSIVRGGIQQLQIADNGSGIEAEYIDKAFVRHATSKIASAEDLGHIHTLGFRGEALASIASVARVEVLTRTEADEYACCYRIEGGEPQGMEPGARPRGTTVTVNDLFYNTPARLKFMKSDGAESGLIIDFLSQMALAYKDVKFRLINNGKVLFATTGDGNRLNSIIRIYKDVDAKNMAPLAYQEGSMALEGYISTPAFSKTTRGSQIFFVNGRVVNSKVMEKGVTLGYQERLFEGRYPVVYLFLSTDPAALDVNIHPNKREVRFDHENEIAAFISRGIVSALATESAVVDAGNLFNGKEERALSGTRVYERVFSALRENTEPATKTPTYAQDKNIFKYKQETETPKAKEEQVDIKQILSSIENPADALPKTSTHTSQPATAEIPLRHDTSAQQAAPFQREILAENMAQASAAAPPAATQTTSENGNTDMHTDCSPHLSIEQPSLRPFDFSALRATGVIFNTYITAVDEKNFYLLDQHAAHERIFYEKLVGEYEQSEKSKQMLMLPLLIHVSLAAREDRFDWFDALNMMGFTMEEFGDGTYRVSEIPMFMELTEAEDFIRHFIDNIKDSTDLSNRVVIDKLITMSCKAAVKAHDALKPEEITALLHNLAKCRNPFSCPHGRPTFIKLTEYEIEKMFKRV